jgi:hypothetical protein
MSLIPDHDIPIDILNHSRKLREYATIQGWGGMTGNGLWALEGIGPTQPYVNRIAELESRLGHLEQAWINNDRLRQENQLMLEALHDAVGALDKAKGRYHTQQALETLLKLARTQKTTISTHQS